MLIIGGAVGLYSFVPRGDRTTDDFTRHTEKADLALGTGIGGFIVGVLGLIIRSDGLDRRRSS